MASQRRLNAIAGHVQGGPHVMASSVSALGKNTIGVKSPDDVVIVSALRTPIGKAGRGSFKSTTPDDLLVAVLKATIEKTGIDPKQVQDICVGNVQLGGAYAGPARMAALRAGFPVEVSLSSVNRQCSSGLQSVANIAAAIKAGMIDCGIGAGVESMSYGGGVAPGSGKAEPPPINLNEMLENQLARDCLTPMGVTAETVAERYGITRAQQDELAVRSHAKALEAQAKGYYRAEMIPVTITVEDKDGNEQTVVVDKDDGPRAGTTIEGLSKLKTVFKPEGGSVTAGSASQVSDGAAAVLLMSRAKANQLGLRPIGVFRGYNVVGVQPDEMGIGPAAAIPLALNQVGLKTNQVDIYEINEAFASQAVYCVNKLGIDMSKVNPVGGAIALGHPLGCTGARQVATLLHGLKRTGGKTGVVSMCIGTGMGAAAVLEAE